MTTQPLIFTLGHSTHPWDEFVALLQTHHIALLADIRSYPTSRHCPQFNQEAMRPALAGVGIDYRHLPALGGRRRARLDSPNTGWRHPSFRGYADWMETAEFAAGLDELMDLARQQRVAYMCSEALWWKCHRRLVSDKLAVAGWQVWHIMDAGAPELHRIAPPAMVVDGKLCYHSEIEQLPLIASG